MNPSELDGNNPYDFLPAPPSRFIGRWSEVDMIAHDMACGASSYGCIGGRRCGKTSMLRMVEHILCHDSRFAGRTVVLYEDPMGYKFISPNHVFAVFLRHLCERVDLRSGHLMEQVSHPRIDLSDIRTYDVAIDSVFDDKNPQITAEQFGIFVDAIFSKLEKTGEQPMRLVILIDEMENFLKYDWQIDFYEQLRSAISSGPAYTRLRVVLAGSKGFLIAPGYRGSPLMNMLKHIYLSSLNEVAIQDLCARVPGIPADVKQAVWRQSGGHPYIATYLLHHFFENRLNQLSICSVDDLALRFVQEERTHLETWSKAVGLIGLQVFGLFVDAPGWVDRHAIIRQVAEPTLNVPDALNTLSYHCLLFRNEISSSFAGGGHVFRTWYLNEMPRLIKELSPEPLAEHNLAQFFLQLIFNGPLSTAFGSGSIANVGNIVESNFLSGSDHTLQQAKGNSVSQASQDPSTERSVTSIDQGDPPMPFTYGYALLIGVDQNNVADYNLSEVTNDIDALQRVLTHPDRCAYPPDHVKIVTGANATREGILDGLTWLSQQLAAESNATAVIHYSGHGWQDAQANPPVYYLIPYDMRPNQIRTRALRATDFASAIADIHPRRLLVLLDCCHAGGMGVRDILPLGYTPEAVPEKIVKDAFAPLGVGSGRAVISSSTGEQVSHNRKDRTMGIFTYHLIEALTGHAEPKEGSVDVLVTDVISYLQRSVPATAKAEYGRDQQPVVELSGTAFPVSLLLGGRGLSRGLTPPDPLSAVDFPSGSGPNITGDDNVTVVGSGNVVQHATGGNAAQATGAGSTATVNDHSWHTAFDQRRQKVTTQYNIAGDYNPGLVEDRATAIDELNKLLNEVAQAAQAGVLDEESATDTEYQVKKAMQQAQKSEPDKLTIINHLNQAKEVTIGVAASVAAATGLVTAISQAIQMVQKLF